MYPNSNRPKIPIRERSLSLLPVVSYTIYAIKIANIIKIKPNFVNLNSLIYI